MTPSPVPSWKRGDRHRRERSCDSRGERSGATSRRQSPEVPRRDRSTCPWPKRSTTLLPLAELPEVGVTVRFRRIYCFRCLCVWVPLLKKLQFYPRERPTNSTKTVPSHVIEIVCIVYRRQGRTKLSTTPELSSTDPNPKVRPLHRDPSKRVQRLEVETQLFYPDYQGRSFPTPPLLFFLWFLRQPKVFFSYIW